MANSPELERFCFLPLKSALFLPVWQDSSYSDTDSVWVPVCATDYIPTNFNSNSNSSSCPYSWLSWLSCWLLALGAPASSSVLYEEKQQIVGK
uniref:HDC19162 n=1 Tax=Drosophila melanogaster TaxID=7227 RepID=Q6IIB2_DROME|nr:TPA_inf: HDC19162 [Drosophila melanogaster]